MAMCIYNNCTSVQKPFSSLAFFALPKDYRRRLWIENSGNPDLATLSESARRVVCQKHFNPKSLRCQFHRTTLSRDAVPERWDGNSWDPANIVSTLSDFCAEPTTYWNVSEVDGDPLVNVTHSETETIHLNDEDDEVHYVEEERIDYVHHPELQSDRIEFVELDNDESVQTIIDDNSIHTNQNDAREQINDDECIMHEERLSSHFPPFYNEVEIETARKSTSDMVDVAPVEHCSNNSPDEHQLDESSDNVQCDESSDNIQCDESSDNVQCDESSDNVHCEEAIASDVIVSSSTTTSQLDGSGSGVHSISNQEDKYFALAIVGILERISPQKKAFAKVNILRYLTELEYGLEATIK